MKHKNSPKMASKVKNMVTNVTTAGKGFLVVKTTKVAIKLLNTATNATTVTEKANCGFVSCCVN